MKCNPLQHILEVAKDKEVPRQVIVNDLEALVKELREKLSKAYIEPGNYGWISIKELLDGEAKPT